MSDETFPDSISKSGSFIYSPSNDISSQINYNASDSIWFNVARSTVFLYGNAHVDYGEMSLDADRMEINYATNLVCAFAGQDSLGNYYGVPDFKDQGQEVQALELCYNYNTKRARIAKIYLEQDEWKIQGDTVLVDEEKNLYIKDGTFCPCDDIDNGTYIKSKRIKIIPGDKVVTGPFNLYIADIPTPLGFIFGYFPTPEKKSSGIIVPTFGETEARGFYLRDGGYYWAVNDYVGAAFTGEVYSKGGWGLGSEIDYKKRYRYSGDVSFKFRDVRYNNDDAFNRQSTKDYEFRWKHTPVTRGGKRFTSDVNVATSSFNSNNSFSQEDYIRNSMASNIMYSSPIKKTPFSYSINLRHDQSNQTGQYNFSLPNANLSMSRLYFFKPLIKGKKTALNEFIKSIGSSYNFKFENRMTNKFTAPSYSYPTYENGELYSPTDTVLEINQTVLEQMWKTKKLGMRHSIPISGTYKIGQALNINGAFTWTENWYTQNNTYTLIDSSLTGTEDAINVDTTYGFSRVGTYTTSVSMTSRIYGFYGFKGSNTVIRHLIVPTIGFQYNPDFSEEGFETLQDENENIVKDDDGEDVKLNKYQDALYKPSTSGKRSALTFGLTNQVELKIKKNDSISKKIKIFDNLGVRSSYNFAADEFQLAPFVLSANTNILNVVSFQSGMTIEPYIYDYEEGDLERETKVKQNKYAWDEGYFIGNIERANFSLSSSLNPDKFKKGKKKDEDTNIEEEMYQDPEKKDSLENAEMEIEDYEYNNSRYVNFKVPWNLRLRYNFNYTNQANSEKDIIMNLQFSGDFKLTPKWRIGYSMAYDFENNKFATPSLNIYRDLNCWELRVDWIPFGPRQSYGVYINIKSQTLKDLKVSKKNTFYDQ